MSFNKFQCENFKNFLKRSKVELERSLYGFDRGNIEEIIDKQTSLETRIINNLEVFTREGKIIWSKDSDFIYRGIVIENCSLTDYKIMLCKEKLTQQEVLACGLAYPTYAYRISFIKGVLTYEKIEVISDSYTDEDELITELLETIEGKLLQQKN